MFTRNSLLGLLLCLAATLCGCRNQSKTIPPKEPAAVRVATVTRAETSAERLRYSASILPYAEVDLAFRSSGYVTNVAQVRGADGRQRDIGPGDYADQGLTLAHIRRQDVQNEVAQARAQLDQAVAQGPIRTSSGRRLYTRPKASLSRTTMSLRKLSVNLKPRSRMRRRRSARQN